MKGVTRYFVATSISPPPVIRGRVRVGVLLGILPNRHKIQATPRMRLKVH
jgi:hypothetical protein